MLPIRRGTSWPRVLAALAFLWLASFLAPRAGAQTQEEAHAIFLFNFARFVEWPDGAFADAKTPVTIAVVGDSTVARALERYAKGKDANGRDVQVLALSNAHGAAGAHIVYVGERRFAKDVITLVASQPVLSVGEEEDFIESGGVIRLFSRDNKVQCAINVKAAESAGLKLGEKLIKASS